MGHFCRSTGSNIRKVEFEGGDAWGSCEGIRVVYGFVRWHPEKDGALKSLTAKEYLDMTSSTPIDDELLAMRFNEAEEAIRTWHFQSEWRPDDKWLTDMTEYDGCSLDVLLASFVPLV